MTPAAWFAIKCVVALGGLVICVIGLALLWSAKDDHDMAEQYKAPATGFGDSE